MSGKANYKPHYIKDEIRTIVGHYKAPVAIILNKDIPSYVDDQFWSAYEIWNNTRHCGSLPYSKGWAEHPQHIVDLISIFQQEYVNITREYEAKWH